ncbi:helix-turn-helix domain-containing protein [Mesorhizobium sp. M0195]|uniref:helix-turn-helix domain-containing protein n=1 Tax=Mesorhizobium sp. M0195 TaxID=2956910 RepID=UPI00333BC362
MIADNANGKSYLGRGAIRRGEALLPGLLRCARCGRRLHVAYSGKGGNTQRYVCRGTFSDKAVDNCIRFGGMRVDRAVVQEVLGRLQPLGIEAALAAMEVQGQEHSDKRQQVENACRQARYEAERARRQYNAVDPENRLVAGELERRWNEKLTHLGELEEELDRLAPLQAPTVSADDRARLMALGKDLAQAWDSPGASNETRKKIIRLLVKEIIVDVVDDSLALIIHWQGGDHTRLIVKKNKVGQTRWTIEGDTLDLVRVLARQMSDLSIAAILNRAGKRTGKDNSWTRSRVCSLRNTHGIAPYRDGERAERGEATLDEAAGILQVSPSTVRRMVNRGTLAANQLCKGAPWIIHLSDIENDAVRREADARRSRRPASHDPRQNVLNL